MQLRERVSETATTTMRIVDGWYEVEDDGYQTATPVLHFFGRDEDDEYCHFTVDDFRPYFLAPRNADVDFADLAHDRRVMDVSATERTGIDAGTNERALVRVTVECPWHVKQLRSTFEQTWEADVLFPQRFLIDRGIKAHCAVPEGDGPHEATAIEAVEDPDVDVTPRVCTWDIEVVADDGVPDPSEARKRVTGVTLYDSYVKTYVSHVLRCDTDAWQHDDDEPIEGGYLGTEVSEELDTHVEVTVHDDERSLLHAVVKELLKWRPDIIVGWNNDAFDTPYFINRCFEMDVNQVTHLSPTRNLEPLDGDGVFINSSVNGIHVFDLLAAYEKSQYTQLDSYGLEDVAAEETDLEKMDVDEQEAWLEDPVAFTAYNVRDVEATVAINQEVNLL